MISGLKLALEVMSPEEEGRLIDLIEASGLAYPQYDAGNRRSSASYGWKYDYLGDRFVAVEAMPSGFDAVAATAAAHAGVAVGDLAECLLNRYEPGAIIQPHVDKPVWRDVIGVSLGASTVMEFRRAVDGGFETEAVELPPRSIYHLAGDARDVWEHSLPPVPATRWSITFRTFSELGLRLRDGQAMPAAL